MVHGPGETVDEIMAQWRAKRGDGLTPVSVLPTSYQPRAAATGGPTGSPPVIVEIARGTWLGNTPVNRFSMNPGAEAYSSITGPAPTMFAAGDLPIMTGSG